MARVLVFSDTQSPFEHPKSIEFFESVANKYKCDKFVHCGDEIDAHWASKFVKCPEGYGARREHELALDFLSKMYKRWPSVKVCTSNHTQRPWLRAMDVGIPKAFLKDYRQALNAPNGWLWSDEHHVDGVKYIHGEEYTGAQAHLQAAKDHNCSVVIGHIHGYGGVQYLKRRGPMTFGMNVGCMIDQQAYAFRYGAKKAYWGTLGCGVVLDGEHAIFIPFLKG